MALPDKDSYAMSKGLQQLPLVASQVIADVRPVFWNRAAASAAASQPPTQLLTSSVPLTFICPIITSSLVGEFFAAVNAAKEAAPAGPLISAENVSGFVRGRNLNVPVVAAVSP